MLQFQDLLSSFNPFLLFHQTSHSRKRVKLPDNKEFDGVMGCMTLLSLSSPPLSSIKTKPLQNKSETQTCSVWRSIMVHSLRQDETFFNKIISRKSTEGGSSRILYYRTPQGIPFKWEEQPGTPKNPQSRQEEIPPLSPPPAVLSSAFPKPCVEKHGKSPPWAARFCRLWFNRKGKRSRESKRVQWADSDKNTNLSFKSESLELCSSECESMEYLSHSRSSSSSSLSSFNRPSSQSLMVHQRFLGCSLWNSRRV